MMFSERDRQIYKYTINGKTVAVDPLRLEIRLKTACDIEGEAAVVAAFAQREDLNKKDEAKFYESLMRVADACRTAFNLTSFEADPDNGVTDLEAFELMHDFLTYVGQVKKKHNAPQTLSEPTAQGSSPKRKSTTKRGAVLHGMKNGKL